MKYLSIVVITIFASLLLVKAAPASTQIHKLNRTKRNREIFDDNFLPGSSVQLAVPARAQTLQNTCGPTVALALLQFLGYTSMSIDISGAISGNLCIDGLILNMNTEPYGVASSGTTIMNFVNTINRYITGNNLNNLRQYTALQLLPSIYNQNDRRINYNLNYLRIARYVYNSLVNRAPVVLGFRGRFSGFEQNTRSHFILISGITINDDGATFYYMDPDGGRHSSFGHLQLNHMLENGGFLVAHIPSTPGLSASGNSHSNRNCPEAVAYGATAGATGGLLAGATVGSSVPVIGTAIGGVVGAAGGLVAGIVGSAIVC